ncbi:MAG: hypothetical protein IPN47_20445 [Gemmatimonadetes bacterium]|nr:hypothetical protein [Gemmatimonadota bacterium]
MTPLTVQRVRQWIDKPSARGLMREAQNLVILTWALQSNRSFHLYSSQTPVEGAVERLPDELEVRTQQLPDEQAWSVAIQRAGGLCGVTVPGLRSAQSLAILARDVEAKARPAQSDVVQYTQRLDAALTRLTLDATSSERRTSAIAVRDLLTALQGQRPDGIVRALAEAAVPTTVTAMGEVLAHASALAQAVDLVQWSLVQNLKSLPTESFGTRVEALLEGLREALRRDEHVVALRPAVEQFNEGGVRLITESARLMEQAQAKLREELEAKRREEAAERAKREEEMAAREAELRRREEQYRNSPPAPPPVVSEGPPKKLMVDGARLETALAKIREDVSSSGDSQVEITWRIYPRTSP